MLGRESPNATAIRSEGRPGTRSFTLKIEYQPEFLDALKPMVERGIGDVEVHIHHGGEGEQVFVDRMSRFLENLENRHGMLRRQDGRRLFGFIHGNWCLDNADPSGQFCGLNNEITLLRDLGCYADFTLPCPHVASQTRMVNTIYWATDDPTQPKSHDLGIPVRAGGAVSGDLMIVPGPLAINWKERRRALVPKIEVGELAGNHYIELACGFVTCLASAATCSSNCMRTELRRRTRAPMLNGFLSSTFECMSRVCAESGVSLNFVTTWQMWNAIESLRMGREPDTYAGAVSAHAALETQ